MSELITEETFHITLIIAFTTAGRSILLAMILLLFDVLFLLAVAT